MTARRSCLLRILDALDGQTSKLHLVKLAFLLSREAADAPRSALYEFVPYQYGPYSFTLYYDLSQLAQDGWIEMVGSEVRLLESRQHAQRELAVGFAAEIDRVLAEYSGMATGDLISRVYRRYPWYTANARDTTKRAVQLPRATIAVYKTGYEGSMVDGVMDRLLRAGIACLIDIRCNPVARRYGFHKSTLQRVGADVGINYVHIPDLGVPSERRQSLDDRNSYTGGVQVLMNGIAAPLFVVAPGQINVQVPWELLQEVTDRLEVQIVANGVHSAIEVTSHAGQPGIFTTLQNGSGPGVITHADGSLVSNSSPAAKGETVIVYCTALGDVTNRPATGSPALSNPLSMTVLPTSARVNNLPAVVSFSGLAPGFIGLYQVNVQVPPNVPVPANNPDGPVVPLVIETSGFSNIVELAVH